jgi:hypothetical protein
MLETYDDFVRSGRFIFHGSRAPAKPFHGFAKPLGKRPTSLELGTARHRALEEILDALLSIKDVDPHEAKLTDTLGSFSLDEDEWAELLAWLKEDWDVAIDPEEPFEELTIEALETAMTPVDRTEKKGATRDAEIATPPRENMLPQLEIRDARGCIRTDFDENSLVQGIKRKDPNLVGSSLSEMVLRWIGSPTAKLVYRLSDDGRYMVTHIDADGIGRTAIADGNPREKVTIAVAGEPKTRSGDHFVLPAIAAALAERFLVNGGQDPCVEWRRSTAHL